MGARQSSHPEVWYLFWPLTVTDLQSGVSKASVGLRCCWQPSMVCVCVCSAGQCSHLLPPQPGSLQVLQGSGTDVGTVVAFQCPAEHQLEGAGIVSCVWNGNSTQWTAGVPSCKCKVLPRPAPPLPCLSHGVRIRPKHLCKEKDKFRFLQSCPTDGNSTPYVF